MQLTALLLLAIVIEERSRRLQMSEHPLMKSAATAAINVLIFLGIAALAAIVAAMTPPAHAAEKQKKESRKLPASSEPVSVDPVSYRTDCVKRRNIKTCERLIEIQKNINDIAKQTVPLQLQ
jgi:hypothetical protein